MDEAMKMVKVVELINSDTAVSAESGNVVFKQIDSFLKSGSDVKIDFEGILLLTTAFLNAAIGQLYKDFSSEELNAHLKLENVAPEDKPLFKMVIERSKSYFKDKKGFDAAANDAIYGS